MAWNGSHGSTKIDSAKKKSNGVLRGGLAGLIVVLVVSAVWVIIHFKPANSPTAKAQKEPAKKALIADNGGNAVKSKVQPKHAKRLPSEMTREERLADMERRYGDNIPESLKTTYYFLKNPPTQTYRPASRREDIFKNHSERTIAAVMLMKPGAFVMQRTVYDESFDRDFQKSLIEPTLITEDDSQEDRELKEAVNEVKAELADRMRAGEKPSEILTAAMNNAYELGKYTANIEQMILDIRDDPKYTDQDVMDYVESANKLLKEKGAEEIEMPSLLRRQARLRILERKRAAKDNQSSEKH